MASTKEYTQYIFLRLNNDGALRFAGSMQDEDPDQMERKIVEAKEAGLVVLQLEASDPIPMIYKAEQQ